MLKINFVYHNLELNYQSMSTRLIFNILQNSQQYNYQLKFQVMDLFTSEKLLGHGNEKCLFTSVNCFIYFIYLTDCVGLLNFIYFSYKLVLYKLMLLKVHAYWILL